MGVAITGQILGEETEAPCEPRTHPGWEPVPTLAGSHTGAEGKLFHGQASSTPLDLTHIVGVCLDEQLQFSTLDRWSATGGPDSPASWHGHRGSEKVSQHIIPVLSIACLPNSDHHQRASVGSPDRDCGMFRSSRRSLLLC